MPELNASLTELTTGATDAILGILALFCVAYLRRYRGVDAWKVGIWTWVLVTLAAAALLGAVVHGLELNEATRELLWRPLYLLLGLLVALFVVAASYDWLGHQVSRRVLVAMIPIALGFFAVTQLLRGSFLVFVVYEAVAMLVALGIYAALAMRHQLPGAGLMALAIVMNIVAAGIQATGFVRFTVIWPFDHNGAFHILQMLAVVVLMLGLRQSLEAPQPD